MSKARNIFDATKSPFNYEVLDYGEELNYAKALESDPKILAWTKRHNIVIRYRNSKGGISRYLPDFLVVRKGQKEKELVEIKGGLTRHDPNVPLKARFAEDWCRERGMKYVLLVK